jgi:hypothetical protein
LRASWGFLESAQFSWISPFSASLKRLALILVIARTRK